MLTMTGWTLEALMGEYADLTAQVQDAVQDERSTHDLSERRDQVLAEVRRRIGS